MTDAAIPPRHIQLLLDSQLAVFRRVARQIGAALRSREPALVPPPGPDLTANERRVIELARLVAEVSGERVVKAFEHTLETPSRDTGAVEHDEDARTAIALLAAKTVDEIDPVQLHAIEMRIGALQGSPPVHRDANPIGPLALLAALHDACASASADREIRLALLNALQPHVALALSRAYDEVNIVLASEGVLPGGLDTPASAAVPVGEESAADTGLTQPLGITSLLPVLDAPVPAPDFDQFVRDLVVGRTLSTEAVRLLTDPAHPRFAVSMSTAPDPGTLQSLTSMQAIRGLAVDDPIDALVPLAAACEQPMPPLDELTGRLMHAVLLYTLRQPDISRDIRREIARLQIIAFRAALLDRTFFTRRDHPFRRFVDGVSELAADPANGTTGDGVLVSTLRRVVDALSTGFSGDLAVFTASLAELKGAVDFAAVPESEALQRAIDALPEIEAKEGARHRAREEIESRLLPSTPRFLANFLATTFADVLAGTRRGREGEQLWAARLALVDRLIWSVAPKNRDTLPELQRALPGLVASLRETLETAGVSRDAQQSILDALFVAHHGVMRHARSPEAERLAREAEAEAATQAAYRALPSAADPTGDDDAEPEPRDTILRAGLFLDFVDGNETRRAKVIGLGPAQIMCALAFQDGTVWHRPCQDVERMIDAGEMRLLSPTQSVVARAIATAVTEPSTEGA